MSLFCVYKRESDNPYETECLLEEASNYSCDNCPLCYSEEEFEDDFADFQYEIHRDLFDF